MDLDLRDGRKLRLVVSGDPAAPPLVYHVGTPHGATPEDALVEVVTQRGLSLVTIARPGYPGSTAQPGRRVADAAADTAAVLEALGHREFWVVGHSGGGPHALACAALLPGCRAAATLASLGPADAPDIDFLSGMGEGNIAEFGAAFQGIDSLTRWLEDEGQELATVTGDTLIAASASLLPPVDRAVLTGTFGEQIAATLREGVAGGIAGWRDDDLAFVASWGFDVRSISTPLAVWQGRQDLMVPFAHGRWLAAAIPGARAHLLDGDGHLSLLARLGEVLDELAEHG